MGRSIRNTKVAVVGGAGFLGSHLVDHLINDRNCQVVVVDNLVSGRREFINGRAEFVHHDITRSEERLYKIFRDCEYVFQYAAEPYIPVSFRRPLHVFEVNASGALKVINAAQEAGCKGILQVSSAEIYGDGCVHAEHDYDPEKSTYSPISEACDVRPHSTYGAAKAAIDALVQIRWKEAKTPVIALRQFNCVGERETHPYVIPEIISQLFKNNEGKKIPTLNLGNNSSRDFQYAGDAVKMATELLEKGQFGEVYNMGSQESIKIYDLAKKITDVAGWREPPVISVDKERIRPWEIWHLQSDNTKLFNVIGKKEMTPLDKALYLTVLDYHSHGCKWCWEK